MRISPVVGRINHLLKYKGTTLYPPSIYDVLDNTPSVENYVVEVDFDENGNDKIIIKTVVKEVHELGEFIKELKDRFRAKIRVAPEIEICHADELRKIIFPDLSRKPVKFIDKRKI
jgi:phenylacetate-CoA ligase